MSTLDLRPVAQFGVRQQLGTVAEPASRTHPDRRGGTGRADGHPALEHAAVADGDGAAGIGQQPGTGPQPARAELDPAARRGVQDDAGVEHGPRRDRHVRRHHRAGRVEDQHLR
ncbi:hypothetical protein Asera_41260 [Actinocatenispora sera]|uniref:Uncharacterized protein n=1 Tax=Actinocatenispora sera TaxID=390989 RepID=A0A810L7F3_9ACTN|nr:hypothetical protein Asera_41260 [Actinocatenispora sera]